MTASPPLAGPILIPPSLEKSGDGWIGWSGGECPVAEDQPIETRLRMGSVEKWRNSVGLDWQHIPDDAECDIIAYRVVSALSLSCPMCTTQIDPDTKVCPSCKEPVA